MRLRIVATIGTVALAALLSACSGQTISGSPDTVVAAAQEVSTDAEVTVEVSGDLPPFMSVPESGDEPFAVALWGDDCTVWCNFESASDSDLSKLRNERVTIVGELSTSMISDDTIYIRNCTVK